MFEYNVYHGDEVIGTATAEKSGLYWNFCAQCHMQTDRIVRVYAEQNGHRYNLGVLLPEAGQLRLERKISDREFSFTQQTLLFAGNRSVWRPFSGTVAGCKVERAELRAVPAGYTLRMDYEPGKESPLMPLFCFLRLEVCDGKLCWLLQLDENYQPIDAQTQKTVDNGAQYAKIAPVSYNLL